MIENVTQYVLGVCIGCILYLIYEVFSHIIKELNELI